MKKLKYFILSLIILGGLIFLFSPEIIPESYQIQEFLNSASQNDVIIIFNSGGWGNTPLEKAKDLSPIIEGIQKTLNEWGLSSIIIPFNRTKNTFSGKITGIKDFLSAFDFSSEIFAQYLETLTKNFPDKKIIVAGLSNGAAFVTKTYEKISGEIKDSVYTIAVGTPFWIKTPSSDNILQLDNNGRDSLAKGDTKLLAITLIKAPFKWILAKIKGQNLTFSQALRVPGHEYSWSSPEVGPQIVNFLENKFR